MKRYEIKYLLKEDVSALIGTQICVKGWVRTKRGNKNVSFLAVNDGSIIHNIQVVADPTKFEEELKRITTGACIGVEGTLVESQGSGQAVEVQAERIVVYGEADPNTYPLQKKGHSMEFLREIGHLRLRTNTFGAVMRLRHNMAMAIHTFFHERGFFYFHTPLITASDCPARRTAPSTGSRTSSASSPPSPSADSWRASWAPPRWARSTPSAPPSAPRTATPRATWPSSG